MATDWSAIADLVRPQVLRIDQGVGSDWGTGFTHFGSSGGTRSVLTAHHVITEVGNKPFRIWQGSRAHEFSPSEENVLFVHSNEMPRLDVISVTVINHGLIMPKVHVIDPSERDQVRVGTEVGWFGFPKLDKVDAGLCFFCGRISNAETHKRIYLIDGISVPGCSGGPVFMPLADGTIRIIGVLSEYLPHTVKGRGDTLLPGLVAAVDVSRYKHLETTFEKGLPVHPERELSFKIDKCPQCDAPLVEGPKTEYGVPVLSCSAGCGELVDLLDREAVESIPGGRRALARWVYNTRIEAGITGTAERRIGLALDRGPPASGPDARPAEEGAADRADASPPQAKAAKPEPAPPPPAIGGNGAGWEWINWVRAGLRDGSVAVNTAGAWLHNIEGDAYVVSPACFEAFAAGRDLAPATVRNRVVRLGRHRKRGSPLGSANLFRAALADGSRVKGMVFPGELVWDDAPPPRGNARLVGKGR